MVGPGSDGAASRNGNLRASSADRERTVDALKAAFAEGHLTLEEHLERAERAYGSRTHAELAALSADLPAGLRAMPPPRATRAPEAHLATANSGRTNALAVASVVCGLVPLLPATLAAIIVGITARRQIQQTGERGGALATTGRAGRLLDRADDHRAVRAPVTEPQSLGDTACRQ